MKRRSKRYEHPTLFISGNVSRRIPLFTLFPEANQIFLNTLAFCREKYGFALHGFVIMADHYHLLVTLKPGTSVSALLRDFKSYVGKRIVETLAQTGRRELLERFRLAKAPQRRKDALYRVLQYDNNLLEVFTPSVLRTKLDYMHANPIKKGLARDPAQWHYSSWGAYSATGRAPIHIDRMQF